jgi:cell division protein FtsL
MKQETMNHKEYYEMLKACKGNKILIYTVIVVILLVTFLVISFRK